MDKTKENKTLILAISLIVVFVLSMILVFVLYHKYESFTILSVKREYNYVLTSEEDIISIPLFFESKKSFLTSKDQVTSTSISNDSYKYTSFLEKIEEGETIKYNEKKYYTFYFIISFRNYDKFSNPVFIENGVFSVSYQNGEVMDFSIGNLNLYINSADITNEDIYLFNMSAVTNNINNTETIVGINLKLKNNTTKDLQIESITLSNKFYDLDYMNYENKIIDTKTDLSKKDGYSYETLSISKGNMNVLIEKEESKELFIPLKYMNGILYIDRLPLYIKYSINGQENILIIDDFMFLSKSPLVGNNGIVSYEYNYY